MQLINPLNNSVIDTFYKPGESYWNIFGPISTAYEECRAETISLYLSCQDNIVEHILPDKPQDYRDEVVKNCWYNIILGGINGLEFY